MGSPTLHKGQDLGWARYLGVKTLVPLAPGYAPKKGLESKGFGIR